MTDGHQTPDHQRQSFARTNRQTISQRAGLVAELLPDVRSIGEICCGDFSAQAEAYQQAFELDSVIGLDIDPAVVTANRERGLDCRLGNALEPQSLRPFLACDVLFFGPPLSVNCDGHDLLPVSAIKPAYAAFTRLLFDELNYQGTIVCIGPKSMSMGDVRQLYDQVQAVAPQIGLRMIHYSYATVTGRGDQTLPRLKYVECWFAADLGNVWEIRHSRPESSTKSR